MAYALDETIVALASAPAGSARAIVRVAGADTAACLADCFAANDGSALSEAKQAQVIPGNICLDNLNAPLPCDIYFWPDNRSYTRSPLAEIHTIGSPPLADALLRTLCARGARTAEPGEFTLRAFLGGRLDLTQAEAVLGVIDAGAEQELQVALTQLAGGLSQPLASLRDSLLELLAHLEAGLDFVEEDIEFISQQELLDQLDAGARQIRDIATQMESRTESAQEVRAVLLGAPNAGKSSLYNALAQADHAIVSQQAGTTRDYLTTVVHLDQTACQLVDTAGVESDDPCRKPLESETGTTSAEQIEAAAQTATADQGQLAQVRLVCFDASCPASEGELALLHEGDPASTIAVLTKCDLATTTLPEGTAETFQVVSTSSETGAGLDDLRQAIADKLAEVDSEASVVASTAIRCHDSLTRAAAALGDARSLVESHAGEEIVAIEIRTALDELGRVTGTIYTDDILDRIFGRFCIGK